MTNKYAVYTKITNIDGSEKDVIIMNVSASSLCAAEHVILDNYRTIDNALAFEMGAHSEYFSTLMNVSECMDISDFARRYNGMMARRQMHVDYYLEEISEAQTDNERLNDDVNALYLEIATLQKRISHLRFQEENNNAYIENMQAELQDFCIKAKLDPVHSSEYDQGIA